MRPAKTSVTHPLPLAAVSPPGGGRILFTMCPGKTQPKAATGPWERDLDMDMDAIAEAGATVMITLMEEHEISACALSLDRLRAASASRGIKWHHNSITDFQAPSADWERSWLTLGAELRQKLTRGETVLLHCRGGRGRAGMIAARLLVELGSDPEDAILQVRQARPEAIETPPQEAYVRTISAIAER